MPHFAILCHDGPGGIHFDFMLEVGDVLKTWAMPQPPRPGVKMECEALGDHRLAYLDYEGPISGDRGSVTRWDHGTYTVERQGDTQWMVCLAGEKLTGTLALRRVADAPSQWICSFGP